MTGTTLDRLQEQLRGLKLPRIAEELPGLLKEASKRELSYTDLLAELVGRELAAKQERHAQMKTTMARFPFHKAIESFDFKFQPSIEVKVIRELATCRFIADADNVLLLGPPGVGKTHLAGGLGLKACGFGYRTMFVTAAGLIGNLVRAHGEGRLEEKLKLLVQPKLLIVDEIGYLPIDRLGANLFFQLVTHRYSYCEVPIPSDTTVSVWLPINIPVKAFNRHSQLLPCATRQARSCPLRTNSHTSSRVSCRSFMTSLIVGNLAHSAEPFKRTASAAVTR